jgi:hypothetical protein
MKHLLTTAALCLCFSASALAQEATAPPAVETMTCEQMIAEMSVAGQQMNAQLDPEFAREAQAMHDQAQGGAQSAPQGRAAQAAAAEQNRARMGAQAQRVQDSMAGLDQNRLMAMATRFEQLGCQTPQ